MSPISSSTAGLVDVHAHLADLRLRAGLDSLLAECVTRGLGAVLANAARRSEWSVIRQISRSPAIFGALGIHPFFPEDWQADTLTALRTALTTLAANEKVIAVGEIGLDFQHGREQADRQIEMFVAQLQLAQELQLPVCLHNRKSWPDFFGILRDLRLEKVRGYCHHFTGSVEIARQALDYGLYLSFCGPVTYPEAKRLHRVARFVPADRMLTETDCPDLPAQAWRGQESRPWQVKAIVDFLAAERHVEPEALTAQLWQNWQRLFFPATDNDRSQ